MPSDKQWKEKIPTPGKSSRREIHFVCVKLIQKRTYLSSSRKSYHLRKVPLGQGEDLEAVHIQDLSYTLHPETAHFAKCPTA